MKCTKSSWFNLFMQISLIAFLSCNQNSNNDMSEMERDKFLINGKIISQESFQALSHELKEAIQREGITGAIPYCHTSALPVIDSATKPYDVSVKRTSLNYRNPANAPDSLEKEILVSYQEEFKNGNELHPIVIPLNKNEAQYFSPIFLKPLCLNCHGTPEKEVMQQTYDSITAYYPNDRAIGYSNGDFRGIWSITFKRRVN